MQVIEDPAEMQHRAMGLRTQGRLLGLVPTMGCLHAGHLSLVEVARSRADVSMVSIFVNPTQFGPNEDFESYPRQRGEDLAACEAHGVDVVFIPSASDLYPPDFSTFLIEDRVGKGLEATSRPGHFRGVATVVAMLFNICRPDVAVFGQKDAQQAALIRRMVRDLHFPTEIVVAPTLREPDGLAMSSRNVYLDTPERAVAPQLYAALLAGRAVAVGGSSSPERVKAAVQNHLRRFRLLREIYVDVVNRETMQVETAVQPGRSLIVAAVWCGQTRLLDNLEL